MAGARGGRLDGLHLPEAHGGQGYGLAELVVVLEALGRVVAPGPFLPTVWASAVIAAVGSPVQQARLLPGLADGSRRGAVALGGTLVRDDGHLHGVGGEGPLALGGAGADVVLLAVGDDLAVVEAGADGLGLDAEDGLDPTPAGGGRAGHRGGGGRRRRAGRWRGGRRAHRPTARGRRGRGRRRRGRRGRRRLRQGAGAVRAAIGSFQAVKHHCADMLVDTELAVAAAWDAARAADRARRTRPLRPGGRAEAALAAVAAARALPAYAACAERRSRCTAASATRGSTTPTSSCAGRRRWRRSSAPRTTRSTTSPPCGADGVRPRVAVELPPEAEGFRAEARAFRARHDALPVGERRAALDRLRLRHAPLAAAVGPGRRGRGAARDRRGAGRRRAARTSGSGPGCVLTLVQCGSPDQVERWVRPSLEGELVWCQLFSEPDAGSDAAAIQTRATRVDGGWLVNGQKVWTSGAQHSNRGLATVRTDPAAPKHAGVTTMAIDMRAPGVDVRPLREITGETLFNEVFFDDVFVPDDDVVGEVDRGWAVARATLGNERVSIGGNVGGVLGTVAADDLADLAARHGRDDVGTRRGRPTSSPRRGPWRR